MNVAGGLAAQFLGLAYALFVSRGTQGRARVVIRFQDGSSFNRGWHLGEITEADALRKSNIQFEITRKKTARPRVLISRFAPGLMKRVHRVRRNESFPTVVTMEELQSVLSAPPPVLNPRADSYLADYRIVESVWPQLGEVMGAISTPHNFVRSAGTEDSISIHWRLGDYLSSDFHGHVRLEAILPCISEARLHNPDLRVRFFSDSPDLVKAALAVLPLENYEVVDSPNIWLALTEMSRSCWFVGTNSGISLLAALAIHHSGRHQTRIFLPSQWSVERLGTDLPPPNLLSRVALYDPRLRKPT